MSVYAVCEGLSKPVQVTPKGNGVFDVTYTPDKEGPVKVDIKYGGETVPNRLRSD